MDTTRPGPDAGLGPQVAHGGQGIARHAMVGTMEGDDVVPPRGEAGQLEGCLDGVRTAGAAELDLCAAGELLGQQAEQFLDKLVLGRSREVQGLMDMPGLNELGQHLHQLRMVVTQWQRSRAGQAVNDLPATLVTQSDACP